jgi:dihydroorotase (multifunctional complex type)
MSTLITNGNVWVNGALKKVDVLIDEIGKITAVEKVDTNDSQKFNKIIDADGCLVLPGGIDAHAHIEDGAETFYEGSCLAAVGGITTVVDMPPFHICSTPSGLRERMKAAGNNCVTDFCSHGGIVVEVADLEQMNAVAEEGVAGFKVFMPADPPVTPEVLWKAIQTAARTGLRMVIHAEESACLESEINWSDPIGFANARPPVAETAATALVLEMALAAGAPVHICHVSSGRTAELIDQYRSLGTDVTAETTPHFLLFDKDDFRKYGASLKTTPPLRDPIDTEMLWQALEDGVIDIIVSDHYLGELPSKNRVVTFKEKEAGIAGLEISLPLLYHTGVQNGKIGLDRFVSITAERPAEIFGFDRQKGKIKEKMDADLVVFDPDQEWTVGVFEDFSRASTLPYEGWRLKGKVKRTLVRGIEVWNGDAIIAEKGTGKFIARK